MPYSKRITIFTLLFTVLLMLFLVRLAGLQLASTSSIQDKIAQLKSLRGSSVALKTLRGKIIDRKGRPLAVDEPVFELQVSYQLTSILDPRVRQIRILEALDSKNSPDNQQKLIDEIQSDNQALEQLLDKCSLFGADKQAMIENITLQNNKIWNWRLFQAWRKNCTGSKLFEKYSGNLVGVKLSELTDDFENQFPDPNTRLILVGKTDIAEMHQHHPLVRLKTDDDIFTAQLEFINFVVIKVSATTERIYPYGTLAAQTIGWVSLPSQKDKLLFEDDRFQRYLSSDVAGFSGIEYVCETLLRGKRGEILYDVDGTERQTQTEFGKDVALTIDAELQKKIEDRLLSLGPGSAFPGLSAVVIDVQTGGILAIASLPTFDLNLVRSDYADLINNASEPMINRAINKLYPPGSSIKPFILIAGLESKTITASEVISCPGRRPPEGWPQCWITKDNPGVGHDNKWPNTARNAIKGSCNIYFSRLADRIPGEILQSRLLSFGFGREILPVPITADEKGTERNLIEAAGIISSSRPENPGQLPPINEGEKRLFGIGQGNLRATPLQIANAMATIARSGSFLAPTLFLNNNSSFTAQPIPLQISPETLRTVYDGMFAVVNETEGTANPAFAGRSFNSYGVTVFGKTGSTENPENAIFAGFAKDDKGRTIALTVIVEGGQRGSKDAAPLGADIIDFCIEEGYIGR